MVSREASRWNDPGRDVYIQVTHIHNWVLRLAYNRKGVNAALFK